MKKLSALLFVLGLCLIPTVDAADPKVAPKAPPKTTPAAQAKPSTTTPAKPTAKDAKAKAAEEKPVVGALIERTDGSGFLNLRVDGGNFVITFLDKDKKAVDADRSRAIIRYRKHLKNNQFILRPDADGKSLRSTGTPVARPYVLPALPVILFKEGQEEVAESYVVQFNQPMPGDGEGIPADEMPPEQVQKATK
jgi:hypothetical protein